MNADNPLEVVLNRLGWRDPAKAVRFPWDEVCDWQDGALDALIASGILKPAEPQTYLSCDECDENCAAMPVELIPPEKQHPMRGIISCRNGGNVNVDLQRLRQWEAMSAWLAVGLVKLLGLRQSGIKQIDAHQWELGIFKGKKERCTITMRVEKGVALLIAGNTVPLLEVLTLTENALVLDKEALAYWVDKSNAENNAETNPPTNPCATFLAMEKLTANELSLTFVGDKSENAIGSNSLMEISARGQTKRVALAALGLIDLHSRKFNSQCMVLLGMTQHKHLPSSEANKKKISRLRKLFSEHLGVADDPFYPYRKAVGWEPRFKLYDKRGAADDRARRDAESRTDSYEELIESRRYAENTSFFMDDENDATARWLRDNDPDA